jgi:uncharacterized protein YraI
VILLKRLLILFFLGCALLTAWMVGAQDIPRPVQMALDDLNRRLGRSLGPADFNWRWTQENYQSSSLGCLTPPFQPVSGQQIGYRIELSVDGITWDYRVNADFSVLFLCSPQATPVPTIRPTTTPPPTWTLNPTASPTATVCVGGPAPRLLSGQMGRVVLTGTPNNVRSAPGTDGPLVGLLQPGASFYIMAGPYCAGGVAWYAVVATESDLTGWTAEGLGNTYWLEPYSPFGTPTPIVGVIPTDAQVFWATVSFSAATSTPQVVAQATGQSSAGFAFGSTLTPAGPTLPTRTPDGVPTVAAVICNASVPPRLVIGGSGLVTPGVPNNLRQGPGQSTAYLGEIPPGGVFEVLDGPRCASGLSWWQVRYNGLVGWTPEGDAADYWLAPLAG